MSKYKIGDKFVSNILGTKIEIIDDDNFYQCSTERGNILELDDELLDNGYTKTEEKENSFKELFDSLCEMVETKDKRYGNAALKPLDIFAKHHNYGARLDEKLARVKNSEELRKNDVADLIGGLALICKDKGWNNFYDQID